MRFVEMEATTFLIRKKGLDPEACRIQATRLVCRGHIRDQRERLFISFGPATEEPRRAIGGFRHASICELDESPRLETGRHGLTPKALPVPPHSAVALRADHVGPMIVLQGVLQRRAIALAIAQQYYRRPQREQWVHLLDQGDMQVFGTEPLLAFAYLPGQRTRHAS